MARILCYLPGNFFHSNVPADRRIAYTTGIRKWIEVLGSTINVTISYQGIDRLIMQRFGGLSMSRTDPLHSKGPLLSWMDAPFGHLLPNLYDDTELLKHHLTWQTRSAWENPWSRRVHTYFFPEFDIRLDMLPRNKHNANVAPILGSAQTTWYSTGLRTEDDCVEQSWDGYETLKIGEHILVPMTGMQQALSLFFQFQRYPDDRYLDDLMQEFQRIADLPGSRVYVFFVDVEAPLVGSHHGLDIWRRFFAAIEAANLSDVFVTLEEAHDHWKQAPALQADNLGKPERNLAVKWTSLPEQQTWINQVCRLECPPDMTIEHPQVWTHGHRLLSLITGSDVLSAIDRKVKGDVSLDADNGPITICHDPTILMLAEAAFESFQTNANLRTVFDQNNPEASFDASWFSHQVAEIISRS